MKKHYLIPLLIALALIISSPINALAEDSTSADAGVAGSIRERAREAREKFQAEREGVKEQLQQDRTKFKGEREDIKEEHRDAVKNILGDDSLSTSSKREALKAEREIRGGKIDDLKKSRIEAYSSRMVRRLSAAIDRVDSLIGRVEERLTKADTKGLDIKTAQASLAEAKTSVSEARIALADFQAKVGDLINTSTPADSLAKVREASQTVITSIKKAHSKVIEAITSLKAVLKDKPEDDSTASSTSNN